MRAKKSSLYTADEQGGVLITLLGTLTILVLIPLVLLVRVSGDLVTPLPAFPQQQTSKKNYKRFKQKQKLLQYNKAIPTIAISEAELSAWANSNLANFGVGKTLEQVTIKIDKEKAILRLHLHPQKSDLLKEVYDSASIWKTILSQLPASGIDMQIIIHPRMKQGTLFLSPQQLQIGSFTVPEGILLMITNIYYEFFEYAMPSYITGITLASGELLLQRKGQE